MSVIEQDPLDAPLDFALVNEVRERLMRAVNEPGRDPVTGEAQPHPMENMVALLMVTGLAIAAKVHPAGPSVRKRTVTRYLRGIRKNVEGFLASIDREAEPSDA